MKDWDVRKKSTLMEYIPCDTEMLFEGMSPIGGPLQRSKLLTIDGSRYLYRTPKYELFWLQLEGDRAIAIEFPVNPESKALFQRYVYDFPKEKREVLKACLVPGKQVDTALEQYYQHSRPIRFATKLTDAQVEVRLYSVIEMLKVDNKYYLERQALVDVSVDPRGSILQVDFTSFNIHDAL